MASHSLERQPNERLLTEIADLKRQVSELRSLQQSSANGLQIVGTPTSPAQIDDVCAAGAELTYNFQLFPAGSLLTTWDFFFTIFVDLPSFPTLDVAYRYPGGFNLTAGQQKLSVTSWGDWAKSFDSTGMRWFNVNIRNNDTASHHIYVAGKFYGPYAMQDEST